MNKFKLILFYLLLFIFTSQVSYAEMLKDEFIDEQLKGVNLTQPETNLNYNYESLEKIPIKLQITEKISTKKNGIYNGQKIQLKVKQNVKYNNQVIIKEGTIVNAEVQTYMTKGMNGIPGTIILDNFEIPNINKTQLKGTYIKKGVSLTLLVLPIKWALTPIPGVGSLTNFIIGGNASINDKDTITVYYYPDWSKNKQ